MQSHGGVAPVAEPVRLAAGAVLSGPAGGVAGSARARADRPRRPSSLRHGRDQHRHLAHRRRRGGDRPGPTGAGRAAGRAASLDIVSIGAGGGSIARVDAGGILHVGPESAGRRAGPGLLRPRRHGGDGHRRQPGARLPRSGNFLGGRAGSTGGAARARSTGSPRALGSTAMAAAEGIHRVVNTNMAEGIRLVSVRRGVDPRGSRCWPSAARPACTSPRSRGSSRSGGSSCRGRRRALGLGHAGDRPALRARAHPRRRRQRARGGRAARLFAELEARAGGGSPSAFDGRMRPSRARPTCATASRSSRSRSTSTASTGARRPDGADGRALPRGATRSSTPTALPDQEVVLVNARVAVIGELPAADRAGAAPRGRRAAIPAAGLPRRPGGRCRSSTSMPWRSPRSRAGRHRLPPPHHASSPPPLPPPPPPGGGAPPPSRAP